jgi:hypothetical protein
MTIEQKVISAVIYTVLVFISGFFVGKRNGSKVDPTELEVRVKALEDKALADLKEKLALAQANTNSVISGLKQAVAEVKPETVAKAIETEIKKVV